MKKHVRSLSVAALLAASCCGAALAQPSIQPSSPEFNAITLRRGACYGQCPVYSVTVFSDGKVKYRGDKDVKVAGARDSTISKDEVELLAATLRYVKPSEMRSQYFSKKDGCVIRQTDHASLLIVLDAGGTKKDVALDLGCSGPEVPIDKLMWLGITIDHVAKPPLYSSGNSL